MEKLELETMLKKLSQVNLERIFIASVLYVNIETYRELPSSFRPTVFSVRVYQDLMREIDLAAKEDSIINANDVFQKVPQILQDEIIALISDVPPSQILDDVHIIEAAKELISRVDSPGMSDPERAQGQDIAVTAGHSKYIYEPMTIAELRSTLGLTIKKDNDNKVLAFFCALSAYTENSQFNISFNAPSSTGKSFIPTQIAELFPKEDVLQLGYCSPSAFFHDAGDYDNDKKGYIVNLSQKILIFLDQPHDILLKNLRSLLSHDKKEILLKITDKAEKGGHKTKSIYLIGYPSVMFCSAGLTMDEQESTRFFMLSPEIDEEKLKLAICENIKRGSDEGLYRISLEANEERKELRNRIVAIKNAKIKDISIKNPDLVSKLFFSRHNVLKPRDQRDIGKIMNIIKVHALLNLWQRDCHERQIVANDNDIYVAFEIWERVSKSQELNLPPFVLSFFENIIMPAWEGESLRNYSKNGKIHSRPGLSRKDLNQKHREVYHRSIPDWSLRQQIIPMLENAGLIEQEPDPKDNRKILIYPTTALTISADKK